MKNQSPPSNFLSDVTRYSALHYLQQKVAARCAELSASFATIEQWQQFRAGLAEALRQRLPIWELSEGPSPCRASAPLGQELILEAIDVHFDEGFYIPVHFYRPQQVAQAGPAVVICPGYGQSKNEEDIVQMGMALARAGISALVVEYDATGERADRPDFETDRNNVTALGHLLGITNVGLQVMTNLAALRYLRQRPEVDSERIGITGLCQGAITTWFTAAVCADFAAVAPVCGATTYEAIALEYCNRQGGWSGASPYVFDLLSVADVQHVVAATAPRPLLVQNNMIDVHWPLSGFEKVKEFTEQIYGLYGTSDRCRFQLEDAPHAYAEPFVSNLVEWFGRVFACQ